jgi:hypothetical protein
MPEGTSADSDTSTKQVLDGRNQSGRRAVPRPWKLIVFLLNAQLLNQITHDLARSLDMEKAIPEFFVHQLSSEGGKDL